MYDRIIRSKRKTLGLEVRENAEVILRLPWRARESDIKRFLRKNAEWLERAKKKILERQKNIPELEFRKEAYVPYLGASYPLKCLLHEKKEGKEAFVAWLKKEAKRICESRVALYAGKAEVECTGVRISSAKKRWGSCASPGRLCFAYRLVLAPLWVLDYVVAHEVSHLLHKNHGKRFWKKVEVLYPKYKNARTWLHTHGHLLNVV
ncbi:MAG: SprT family zinc-dependent metalloprotease [Patescibacteria group bacterium]